jgi:predicted permease
VLVAHIEHASVGMTNAEAKLLYYRFAERAHEIPGITAAAVSIGSPFGIGWGTRISLSGRPLPVLPRRGPGPSQYAVTPEYFAALGVRALSGRLLAESDRMGAERVTVINETAATKYFPGESALGQCVKFGADSMPCWTVVGVVPNMRRQELVEEPVPMFYRPLEQLAPAITDGTVSFFGYTLLVRSTGDLGSTAARLRRTIQAAAPSVPYAEVQAMRDILGRQTRTWRLGAMMFSTFGAIALVLAAVGLYGVVVFSIAQRVHEFGVRLALGARGRDLLRLTILRGVAPAAGGVLVGLALTLAMGRFVSSLLFQVSPRDPLVLGGVSAALLLAAVLASLIPAIRVTRIDPLIAMRVE